MTKKQRNILVLVGDLFVGQLDIKTDAVGFARKGPFVKGFHHPRPPTGYDIEPGIRQQSCNLLSELIVGMFRTETGRSEHAHGRLRMGELLKSLYKFRHDLENPP